MHNERSTRERWQAMQQRAERRAREQQAPLRLTRRGRRLQTAGRCIAIAAAAALAWLAAQQLAQGAAEGVPTACETMQATMQCNRR
jgi:ferric-dicitrate binding protein FerR (iron transport regulator)